MMGVVKMDVLDDELHAKALNWIQDGAMDEVYDFSKMQMAYYTAGGCVAKANKPITFDVFFDSIKTANTQAKGVRFDNKYYKDMWDAYAQDEQNGIIGKKGKLSYKLYDGYKTKLLAVMLSGTVKSNDSREINKLNSCYQIDIDAKDEKNKILRDKNEFAKHKNMLTDDPHALFVCNSPSNRGLKVGFRIDPLYFATMLQLNGNGNEQNSIICKKYQTQISEYFMNKYGLWIDPSVSSENEMFYIPFDTDLRTNNRALIFKAPELPDSNELKPVETKPNPNLKFREPQSNSSGKNQQKYEKFRDLYNSQFDWEQLFLFPMGYHSPKSQAKGIDYNREGVYDHNCGTLYVNDNPITFHCFSSEAGLTADKTYNLNDAIQEGLLGGSKEAIEQYMNDKIKEREPEWKSTSTKKKDTQTDNKIPYVFWYGEGKGEKRKLAINLHQLYSFLESIGIRKHLHGPDDKAPAIVQIKDNVVEMIGIPAVQNIIKKYIDTLPFKIDDEFYKSQLNELILNKAENLLSNNKISFGLPSMPGLENFVRDTANTGYAFYKNGFVEVTAESITFKDYSELKGLIWKSQIKMRNFHLVDLADKKAVRKLLNTDFVRFTMNTCTAVKKDENGKPIKGTEVFKQKKYKVLMWIIGFMLHTYKDPVKAISVILTDSTISGDEEGRSGKSLIGKALEELRKILNISGKSIDLKDKFFWQNVDLDTQIIFIDDLKKNFDPTELYTIITFGISVEGKGGKKFHIPYKESPKMLITNNYGGIKGENGSDKARKITFDFDPYYTYQHTPLDEDSVEHKGKVMRFFTEGVWSDEQWNNFDNFMLFCLKSHLESPDLPKYVSENIEINAISLTIGEDLVIFFENLPKNEAFSAKAMRSNFVEDNPSFKGISQNTFTRKLVRYCKLKKLKVDEKKNNGEKLYTIYCS